MTTPMPRITPPRPRRPLHHPPSITHRQAPTQSPRRTSRSATNSGLLTRCLGRRAYPRQRDHAACLVVPDSSATSLQDRSAARFRAAWPTRSPAWGRTSRSARNASCVPRSLSSSTARRMRSARSLVGIVDSRGLDVPATVAIIAAPIVSVRRSAVRRPWSRTFGSMRCLASGR